MSSRHARTATIARVEEKWKRRICTYYIRPRNPRQTRFIFSGGISLNFRNGSPISRAGSFVFLPPSIVSLLFNPSSQTGEGIFLYFNRHKIFGDHDLAFIGFAGLGGDVAFCKSPSRVVNKVQPAHFSSCSDFTG